VVESRQKNDNMLTINVSTCGKKKKRLVTGRKKSIDLFAFLKPNAPKPAVGVHLRGLLRPMKNGMVLIDPLENAAVEIVNPGEAGSLQLFANFFTSHANRAKNHDGFGFIEVLNAFNAEVIIADGYGAVNGADCGFIGLSGIQQRVFTGLSLKFLHGNEGDGFVEQAFERKVKCGAAHLASGTGEKCKHKYRN